MAVPRRIFSSQLHNPVCRIYKDTDREKYCIMSHLVKTTIEPLIPLPEFFLDKYYTLNMRFICFPFSKTSFAFPSSTIIRSCLNFICQSIAHVFRSASRPSSSWVPSFPYPCTVNKLFLLCSPQKIPIIVFLSSRQCLVQYTLMKIDHTQRVQSPHHGQQDLRYLARNNLLDCILTLTYLVHPLQPLWQSLLSFKYAKVAPSGSSPIALASAR